MQPLDSQLRFLLEADRLKGVLRQSPIIDGSRRENSAEHSWHLALMSLVLGEYAPAGTDLSRVTAMTVVHDLVEIDAGDLFVYAGAEAQARQEEAERAAADRLFGLLPAGQAAEFRALWNEFEERRTPEAKFARALDRLQPMLANYQLGGGTWRAARGHRRPGADQGGADRGRLRRARRVRPGADLRLGQPGFWRASFLAASLA